MYSVNEVITILFLNETAEWWTLVEVLELVLIKRKGVPIEWG